MSRVPLSAPDVGDQEVRFVLDALRSGWVAPAGPDLDSFEGEMAARVSAPFSVGLASGTAALHLALVSWGVSQGDVVPVSTLTFAATVNAIRYVGAEPHFIDSEWESGNMSPACLADAVAELSLQGRRVPVIIPVDLFGKCAAFQDIAGIAESVGARLLCDAAESVGASRDGRAAGSMGDASVFSFNGNKIMTTSGGGMLLTADEQLAAHVRKLSTQAREPVPHYEHVEVGFNYRMSNILAALGRAQLLRLDDMIERRRSWRERYRAIIADWPGVRILGGDDDHEDNCWLTVLVVDPKVAGWSVEDLATSMAAADVETRSVWKPMHLQPVFSSWPATLDGSSERLFRSGIALPSGSAMTSSQFQRIEQILREVGSGA